jgi:hypothetical protein
MDLVHLLQVQIDLVVEAVELVLLHKTHLLELVVMEVTGLLLLYLVHL